MRDAESLRDAECGRKAGGMWNSCGMLAIRRCGMRDAGFLRDFCGMRDLCGMRDAESMRDSLRDSCGMRDL